MDPWKAADCKATPTRYQTGGCSPRQLLRWEHGILQWSGTISGCYKSCASAEQYFFPMASLLELILGSILIAMSYYQIEDLLALYSTSGYATRSRYYIILYLCLDEESWIQARESVPFSCLFQGFPAETQSVKEEGLKFWEEENFSPLPSRAALKLGRLSEGIGSLFHNSCSNIICKACTQNQSEAVSKKRRRNRQLSLVENDKVSESWENLSLTPEWAPVIRYWYYFLRPFVSKYLCKGVPIWQLDFDWISFSSANGTRIDCLPAGLKHGMLGRSGLSASAWRLASQKTWSGWKLPLSEQYSASIPMPAICSEDLKRCFKHKSFFYSFSKCRASSVWTTLHFWGR